jgi:hypothetical protein
MDGPQRTRQDRLNIERERKQREREFYFLHKPTAKNKLTPTTHAHNLLVVFLIENRDGSYRIENILDTGTLTCSYFNWTLSLELAH